jgi:hypothetical protein
MLGADKEAAVRRDIDAVRGELGRAEPDQGVMKTLVRRVVDGVAAGTGTALGGALNLLVKWEMARLGIPIE